VNDLLDLSRLQQGRLPVVAAPMDVRRLVMSTVSQHQGFAEVPMRFFVSPTVPLVVLGDELRIIQIMSK